MTLVHGHEADVDVSQLVELGQFERLAVERMPEAVRLHVTGSAADNASAWKRWRLRSQALVDVSICDTSTTVLGQRIEAPVLIAPYAFQAICHPDGELATAVASARAGTIMVMSVSSTRPPEEVGPAAGDFWMQLSWTRDRGILRDVVARATAAGASALCLTVDMPVYPYRGADFRRSVELLSGLTRDGKLGHFVIDSSDVGGGRVIDGSNFRHMADASVTWADLEWLRGLSPLPLVLKGIVRGDDAKRAVEHGVDAVVVSNHGGLVLDQSVSTADALPEVVSAVDGRLEVLVDGGIRSGADVLRALALGARAVLIGRPALWGLVLDGANGTARVLNVLREELAVLMAMTGARAVSEIDRTRIASRSPESMLY